MLDKQKLLQWVETKNYVNSGPYDVHYSDMKIAEFKGKLELLSLLEMEIRAGRLDAEEMSK